MRRRLDFSAKNSNNQPLDIFRVPHIDWRQFSGVDNLKEDNKNARKVMNQERWQMIEEIFNDALILPIDQRTLFIAEKSDGDRELNDEINELILEAESVDKFLGDSVFILCRRLVKTELNHGSALFAGTSTHSNSENT